MSAIPISQGTIEASYGAVTASTLLTQIAANASANTKGSYTELVSSTPYDTFEVILHIAQLAQADFLIDFAIGGSGSEIDIVPNLLFSGNQTPSNFSIRLPLFIPRGSRVSARCQSTSGSSTAQVAITIVAGGMFTTEPARKIYAYGINTADSGGVQVDPGGSTHTKGSYSEITSAIDADAIGLFIHISQQGRTTNFDLFWLFDVARGAGGSEQIIIANAFFNGNYQPDTIVYPNVLHNLFIPAGTRLAIRGQCSNGDATFRLFDAAIYILTR